jgi:hypothetical protein
MQELDAHRRTIQMHIHIEQMRLNAEPDSRMSDCTLRLPPLGRGVFPSTRTVYRLAVHNGIDRADIGRGEPQLPTAPKALHDGPSMA